ncbi:endolytic transglycosylase MltG [Agrilactobacillus fermenti]|uniref:endolytic transglycosylase MltG n=1 Tax=Agrilactobacillus fermenti TaxID=2586909 RepID=UPI003A5C3E89
MRENNHNQDSKTELKAAAQKRKQQRQTEKKAANRIVTWILAVLAVLVVVLGLMTYHYISSSLKPYDRNSKAEVSVKIPIGSTTKEVAAKLEDKNIIKSATVFNYYVKAHNFSNFQAGTYTFSPAQTLDQITGELQKGPVKKVASRVTVKEGVTVEQIGDAIEKETKFKKADFLKLMKNEAYLKALQKKYPKLLNSTMAEKNVRYHLEGYLFPARYDIYQGDTLRQLVDSMVLKMNQVMAPYYQTIKNKDLTVQQTLTLASLVEREGVTNTDRRKIAGVFFNRLEIDMPIQSDISVMYALNTHKTHLTNKDTAVKSPYNLYKNKGFGPGPFNSPSLESIQAVLNPADRDQDYLYFVADLKTGKVYYTHSYDEHLNTNSNLGQ